MEPPREGTSIEADGVRGWSAGPLRAREPRAALDALFALAPVDPSAWLRRIPGRETLLVSNDLAGWEHGDAVVKRFTGDNARDRWFERLHRVDPRSPARREAENLAELVAAGFAVPRPLAWYEERGARGRSALAMECVDHDETLRMRLGRASASERRAWIELAAEFVARFHTAGWYHRDLYCEHLVLPAREPAPLVMLDLGRARRQTRPRARWFVKDLAALLHSCPSEVTQGERLRFLARYSAARGVERGSDRRELAHAVQLKAARLARHAPRFEDPDGARVVPAR